MKLGMFGSIKWLRAGSLDRPFPFQQLPQPSQQLHDQITPSMWRVNQTNRREMASDDGGRSRFGGGRGLRRLKWMAWTMFLFSTYIIYIIISGSKDMRVGDFHGF